MPRNHRTRKPRAPVVGNAALKRPRPRTFSPCTPPEAQRGPAGLHPHRLLRLAVPQNFPNDQRVLKAGEHPHLAPAARNSG